jgi:hypothetical protein
MFAETGPNFTTKKKRETNRVLNSWNTFRKIWIII